MSTIHPLAALTAPARLVEAWAQYLTDSAQRTLLFWDVLRKRGNDFLEHAHIDTHRHPEAIGVRDLGQ